MARGYPDFFGYSIVPKYGTPVHEVNPGANILAGDSATIFSAVGKGRTYGGWIRWFGTDDVFKMTKLIVIIDTVTQTFLTPYWALNQNSSLKTSQAFSLTGYEIDDVNKYVVYSGERDWTFGQSLIVQLNNDTAANITAVGSFDWAKVI